MLTQKQQRMVEDNLGLVGFAIKTFVRGGTGIAYEDLFQIGSEALCKAAMRYEAQTPFSFSSYALLTIRNTLFNALRKRNKQKAMERCAGLEFEMQGDSGSERYLDLMDCIRRSKEHMTPGEWRGVEIILQIAKGRSTKQVCADMGMTPANLRMSVSRARRKLAQNIAS